MRAIWLAILAFATVPALRVLTSESLRRLFPWVYAAVVAGVLLWGGLVVFVAVRFPGALPAAAVLTALVLLAAAVRARTGYRFRRGLPPGSLSLAASLRSVAERRGYLDRAARHGPIFKVAQFHRNVVCVVGLERIRKLVREHGGSLAPNPLPLTREVTGGFLRYMEEDRYAVYGPLFRKALSPAVVAAAKPATVEAARRELGRLAVDFSSAPNGHLDRIAFDGLVRALFGFEPESAEHQAFRSAYGALAEQDLGMPPTFDARDAVVALRHIVVGSLNADTAATSALTELRQIDPELPDAICVDNLIFTLKFASANVVSLLHWLLAMLGRHPEWGVRMREDPALVDRFVMETLRLAQSEYLYRVVTRDFEFEGYLFPKGWLTRLCVWESHRSPEAFDDPERFDPDRFLEASYRTSNYSPFGWGQHACNGVPLTYMICGAALSTLVAEYEWEVTGDGSAERDFRHWHHWRPSSGLRLGLSPLAAQTAAEGQYVRDEPSQTEVSNSRTGHTHGRAAP